MSSLLQLISQFRRDERGAFAVMFGVMAIVLIALGGATVDYVAMEQARSRAQNALDSAALALQPEIFDLTVTEEAKKESILKRAKDLVMERVGTGFGITVEVDQIEINTLAGSLSLAGRFTIPTIFVNLVGVPQLHGNFRSEAMMGSLDMEIAVALDVTGSMSGSRIQTLRSSMIEFVNEVVQDDQSVNYSKMALIPYSQAVNAGTYAAALRGPIRDPKGITNIVWSTGQTKTVTGATRNGPVTITSNGHGFVVGDWVYIWDVGGMSSMNNKPYQITSKNNNTFQLGGTTAGTNYGTFSKNGSAVKCLYANCAVEVTSNNHGYVNDEWVQVTDVAGATWLNDKTYQVSNVSTNQLRLNGLTAARTTGYVAKSGKMHCTWQSASEGCTYYRYTTTDGVPKVYPATNCVTERAVNGKTDVAPSTTYVGRNYPASGNGCLSSPIVPLTANKADLRTAVNGLTDAGSTAGSLGALWSWYMLSPNFGYVWPEDSRPAAYGREHLMKAAVFMTDGEFNTVHCNGVVAQNSTSGSGGDHINCTAPNGDPYVQARAYCDAMKAEGRRITIYTVAFDIAAGTPAANLMSYCASSPAHSFSASNTTQLRQAFQQIARQLSALRITR